MPHYITQYARRMERSYVEAFWHILEADKLVDCLFYDNSPQSAAEFYEWAIAATQDVRFIEDESGRACAMYWLNNCLGKAAMIHFCYVRACFSEQEDIGLYVVRGLLNAKDIKNKYVLSSLFGLTPKVYRHVFPFLWKLGFEQKLILPQSCYFARSDRHVDGVLSVLTRETMA